MNEHVTFDGKIKGVYFNVNDNKFEATDLTVNYSIENGGEVSTVSIGIPDPVMFTFNYKDLKRLVEGVQNGKTKDKKSKH